MKLLKNAGIYVLRKRDNSKCYVGKDHRLGDRVKQHLALNAPKCKAIHNAIKKHGAEAFDVELMHYPNISMEALKAVEKWKIRRLKSHYTQGGYNLTWGGDGLDPETARENALKAFADGTHPFLDSEFQRANNLKRVANGTHHFLGGEIPRKAQRKRVNEGTHHFLGGEIARKVIASVLLAAHIIFLGVKFSENGFKKEHIIFWVVKSKEKPVSSSFLTALTTSLTSLFRVVGGMLIGFILKTEGVIYTAYTRALLTAKSVCEERIYRKRTREGYFDVSIPDTSKSEQLTFLTNKETQKMKKKVKPDGHPLKLTNCYKQLLTAKPPKKLVLCLVGHTNR